MADTPEQARVRESLRARGNQLAPRADGSGVKPAAPAARAARPARAKQGKIATVKKVAEGGAEGGLAGAGRAAVKSKLPKKGEPLRAPGRHRAPGGRAPGAAGAAGPRASRADRAKARRQVSKGYATLTGRSSGGVLLAEYFGGALLISATLFNKAQTEGYLNVIGQVMVRLTALTGVFFVLFLMAGTEKLGKFAAWFGLLVDLGILFTAVQDDTVKTIGMALTGQPTGVKLTDVVKSTTVPEPTTGVQLPDE